MDIIVGQFNVIGLRAEFPKRFTKNVYVYMDSRDQQSLRMLERKKLRGFRARTVWNLKDTERYCLICCELNKREEQAFLEAMDELHRNLLIKGYRDYEERCDEVFNAIKQGALTGDAR